jgi:flagellum-specific ATP synthase
LLGNFATNVDADIVVIALIGERGRELGEFVSKILGPEGMKRTIIIVATSDQSATERRRSLWTAITIAEFFRDRGNHVLLLADSITRFAEAHREISLAGGEDASLKGFPPSTTTQIMAAAERTGPGKSGQEGDITAVFSVLVSGSNMEGMVADTLRGVLDGHVVLDREIAERGRFPAIDLLRSVSRSLPDAASEMENEIISIARRRLGAYDRAELMVQSGLYVPGSDSEVDAAIQVWPALDDFLTQPSTDPESAFQNLKRALRLTGSMLSSKK